MMSAPLKAHVKNELSEGLRHAKLKDKEVWIMRHCINLVIERDDDKRVGDLIALFRIGNPNPQATIKDFYFWYKDRNLTEQDAWVYKLYVEQVTSMQMQSPSPDAFSGLGYALINKLVEWRGDAGNTIDTMLRDYFKGVLPRVCSFQPRLIFTPRSLLGDYGWSLFIECIDSDHGGKHNYLVSTPEEIKESNSICEMLGIINSYRHDLLKEGKLQEYDELGHLLTQKPVKDIYDELPK